MGKVSGVFLSHVLVLYEFGGTKVVRVTKHLVIKGGRWMAVGEAGTQNLVGGGSCPCLRYADLFNSLPDPPNRFIEC